jgi:cell division transport system permease protein
MTRNRRRPPPAAARVKIAPRGFAAALSHWRDLHLYSSVSSLGRLSARPFATLLTVGVMAVALALPLALALLLNNLKSLAGAVEQAREIGVFLALDLDETGQLAALQVARDLPGVATVELRTPEQGLAEFRRYAGFGEALELIEDNPIPAVLEVVPSPDAKPAELVRALEATAGVEFVQHDALWRERLDAWLSLGERGVQAFGLLLLLGALLVVGNTVRLDVQGRAEEISVIQLLGGTPGFIRRPFLYLGAWYGLLSGMAAMALLAALKLGLSDAVDALVASYDSRFRLQGFGIVTTLAVTCGAAALGWLGAFLAVGHHLRQGQSGRTVDVD